MAEYYRILSYLYRYDKKKKIDCKGFVKAEQKKNGVKITLQIDDERLPENVTLALCFYNRQEGIHNEELPDKRMQEENHHVGRKAGGRNSDRWHMQQLSLLEAVRPHEETVLFYSTDQLPDNFDIRKQDGIILFYQEFFFYGSIWVGEEIPIEDLLIVYRQKEDLPDQKEEEEEASVGQDDNEETGEDDKLSVKKKDRVPTQPVDRLEKMWINIQNTAESVDNIFNPAFRSGYRINLEQLSGFGSEVQSLSENQFLAKGYALYHHLLIGKVTYGGEERYCIGVPGIYENRERYMAQLYQFPIFLSLTENRIKTGGFGYWLHLLTE